MTLGQYVWWLRRGIWPWQARAYLRQHGAHLERGLFGESDAD